MGKIHVLDKHVAELIAAGEVVERPSSVIKEVVENAIDAGATSITVEIQHGGTTFMRVTDDGCGIAREDVPKAFIRHATSKVYQQDDLDHIGTLGFRGEALASICAVSKVTLLTRTQEELAGTHYQIDGGESESGCEDAGCPVGTTLVIRDLFYNTPARMKFLKKDVSEANAVAGVVDRIALSHPEISIRFIRDGKNQLQTPGDGQLKSCIYAVYGKEFTGGLIPVDYQLDGVKVTGFVSKPSASRPTRSMQHFFINGRYVKSRTAMAALEEAFKGSIMVGKFPSCVLHLEISCEAVDVNVHPAKIEVRFINERPIFEAVYHGVKSALLAGDSRSELSFSKKVPSHAMDKKKEEPPKTVQEKWAVPTPTRTLTPLSPEKQEKMVLLEETSLAEKKQNHQEEEPEVSIPPKTVFSAVRVSDIGQSIPYEDAMKHRQIEPEKKEDIQPAETSPQQEPRKIQEIKKKEQSIP
ncbi:MAG: DNA mismatch repair endonuclease MutL, partial [Clostridium sp.]